MVPTKFVIPRKVDGRNNFPNFLRYNEHCTNYGSRIRPRKRENLLKYLKPLVSEKCHCRATDQSLNSTYINFHKSDPISYSHKNLFEFHCGISIYLSLEINLKTTSDPDTITITCWEWHKAKEKVIFLRQKMDFNFSIENVARTHWN